MSDLRRELEESEERRQALEEQAVRDQQALEELKAACENLEQQNERQLQELRHREKEAQIQTEQNRQLQNKNAEQDQKLRILAAEIELYRQQEELRSTTAEEKKKEAQEPEKEAQEGGASVSPQEVAQLKDDLEDFRRHIAQTLAGFEESLNQLTGETTSKRSSSRFFR